MASWLPICRERIWQEGDRNHRGAESETPQYGERVVADALMAGAGIGKAEAERGDRHAAEGVRCVEPVGLSDAGKAERRARAGVSRPLGDEDHIRACRLGRHQRGRHGDRLRSPPNDWPQVSVV